MNYTLADLDKAIYFCLTFKKDNLVSYDTLYTDLCSSGICTDLINHKQLGKKRFESACETIIHNFDDVYHVKLDNMKDYLIFTNKTCMEILMIYGGTVSSHNGTVSRGDSNIQNPLLNVKQDELMINKNWLDEHNPLDQYNRVDTFMHAICRHADIDLFEYVISKYDIDFATVNKSGQTIIDVIPNTQNGFIIMQLCASYSCKQNNLLSEDLYNKVNEIELLTGYKIYYKKKIDDLTAAVSYYKSSIFLMGMLWFGQQFIF